VAGWRGLGDVSLELGRGYQALVAFTALRDVGADEPPTWSRCGSALAATGQMESAVAWHRRATRNAPDDPAIAWMMARDFALLPDVSRSALAVALRAWGDRFANGPAVDEQAPMASLLANRKLRVGVVLTAHYTGEGIDFLVPLIEEYDRSRMDLVCFADVRAENLLIRRLRNRIRDWHDIAELDDETVAMLIRNEELDVLIDLEGPGVARRPGVFAHRPAPRAFSIMGLPEAAGALGFDSVIDDGEGDPAVAGSTIIVPGGLLVLPSDPTVVDLATIHESPGTQDPIIFGSTARRIDITATIVGVWADILAQAPGSIIVFDRERLGGDDGEADVRGLFADHGVTERIAFVTERCTTAAFLGPIDILLVPFETLDADAAIIALMLGRPVVTCPGALPRARALASFLKRLGLDSFVAQDDAGYVAAAVALAKDRGALAHLAEDLRKRLETERQNGAKLQSRRLIDAIEQRISGRQP
jgi:predicted O-linked N-acetylglucosamine transferase (SPINDLY family)